MPNIPREAIVETILHLETTPDYTSYHLLLSLRQQYPDHYAEVSSDVKARILCSSLAHFTNFSDWGYLEPTESYDGEAARALLYTGADALPFLLPVLDDKTRVWLEGSVEGTLSKRYQYRRCDFAYRYACLILQRPVRFSTDPATRDSDIRLLQEQCKQKGN